MESDRVETEEERFDSVDKLTAQGINAGGGNKLQAEGACNSLMAHTEKVVISGEKVNSNQSEQKTVADTVCTGLPEINTLPQGEGTVGCDSIVGTIKEEFTMSVREEDGSVRVRLSGNLSLLLSNKENRFVQLQVAHEVLPGLIFTIHPHMDKDLFRTERIVRARDANQIHAPGYMEVIRWRIENMDENSLPLIVNYDVDPSPDSVSVRVHYSVPQQWDIVLENVKIYIPLHNPAFRARNAVKHITEGEYRWYSEGILWYLPCIGPQRCSRCGYLEISASKFLPWPDLLSLLPWPDRLYPISVSFTTADCFSGIKVEGVLGGCSAYTETRIGIGHYNNLYPEWYLEYQQYMRETHANVDNDDNWVVEWDE